MYPIPKEAMMIVRKMHDPKPITPKEERVLCLLTEILNLAFEAGKQGKQKPPEMEVEEATPERAKACRAFNNLVLEAYEEGVAKA